MGVFRVSLVKTVDDSYDIETGRSLTGQLVKDLRGGLMGSRRRFALITDSNVEKLYAEAICQSLKDAGFEGQVFAFPAGEKSKTRETKADLEDRMLRAGYRRDCFVLAVGGGVVSDLAGFLAGTFGRGDGLDFGCCCLIHGMFPFLPVLSNPGRSRRRWPRASPS